METLQNNFIKGFAEMVEEVTNNRKITTNQQNLIDSMQGTIEAMQKELDSCKKTITTMSMTVDKIDTIERQVDVTDSKVKKLAVQQQEQGDKLKEIDRELNASQDKEINEKYARYDKLDELERQIKNATRRKDDIDRAIESGTELSGLIVEIENFLKTKLCPINYSRAIFEQKNSPVVIENVTEIVSVVEQWCYDMKKMIKTTINSDEYDGEIIDVEINK